MQAAFLGQEIREHLSEQQQHDAEVNQHDADLPFARLIVTHMRAQQVDEQHGAEKVTAGEDGDVESGPGRLPVNEKAAEEFVLGLVQSEMHLCQRAPKHQNTTSSRQVTVSLSDENNLIRFLSISA